MNGFLCRMVNFDEIKIQMKRSPDWQVEIVPLSRETGNKFLLFAAQLQNPLTLSLAPSAFIPPRFVDTVVFLSFFLFFPAFYQSTFSISQRSVLPIHERHGWFLGVCVCVCVHVCFVAYFRFLSGMIMRYQRARINSCGYGDAVTISSAFLSHLRSFFHCGSSSHFANLISLFSLSLSFMSAAQAQ